MWTFSWKKRNALGIDLSCRTIRVLHLSRTRRGYKVEGFGEHELPTGAVLDKRIKDPGSVSAALSALLSDCGIRRPVAAIALPATLVMTRQLEFPATLSEAELELHVRLEAERQLPFPSSELALDFALLPSSTPASINLTLAACRKEHVDERLAVLHKAGCQVSVVAMETQVVERAFRVIGNSARGLIALVDLQAASFTLYLMRDGVVVHWREQSMNGLELSARSDSGRDEVALGSMTVVSDLASQILRTLHLFHSSADLAAVERLWLTGTGAAREYIVEGLSQLLDMPVSVANPLASLADSHNADGSSFFMAAGLALRGLQDD